MVLLVGILSGVSALADVTVDAPFLVAPSEGAHVSPGVKPVEVDGRAALTFGDGGITLPMAGHLSAGAGGVDVVCRLPEAWPSTERSTLFHVGEQTHVHVTLFFRAPGQLVFVYKAGEEYYASISHPGSRLWTPGSRHRIEASWGPLDGRQQFWLRCDGTLIAMRSARLIETWPRQCYIGSQRSMRRWRGLVERMRLTSTPLPIPELEPGEREIRVDADRTVGTCHNFWSVSNFTSEDMFADPAKAKRYRTSHSFMRYVNCVRLLGGREDGKNQWFKGVSADGTIQCDFSGLIGYLRGMLDAGYVPRIVLDNVPTAMSDAKELHTYGNTYPPKDPEVWHAFISAAVRAMVDAFGDETVSGWRFRVGTEPDLYPGHWAGTKEDYLVHYDYTVDAVTGVIPDADIGPGNILNPARIGANNVSKRKQWGLEIVDHAANGTNRCTGATGTRLCYLQCSWYGQVGVAIDTFDLAVTRMRDRLARYPQFEKLPVDVAEFAILRDDANQRLWCGDITEWGASWYAAIAERVYELGVDQVHEWAQTTAGIKHPRALVIGMLEELVGGDRLAVEATGTSAARCGAIACRKGEDLYVLLFNHRAMRRPSVPEQVRLALGDLRMDVGAAWTVSEWLIDEEHGVFAYELYRDCEAAGLKALPKSPLFGGNVRLRFGPKVGTVLWKHRKKYLALARPKQVRQAEALSVAHGKVMVDLTMPGHSVRLLKFSPGKEGQEQGHE